MQTRVRVWGATLTEKQLVAVKRFVQSEIGIQEFMDTTGTTRSGCYSMIARGVRHLFYLKRLQLL